MSDRNLSAFANAVVYPASAKDAEVQQNDELADLNDEEEKQISVATPVDWLEQQFRPSVKFESEK